MLIIIFFKFYDEIYQLIVWFALKSDKKNILEFNIQSWEIFFFLLKKKKKEQKQKNSFVLIYNEYVYLNFSIETLGYKTKDFFFIVCFLYE